MGAAFLVAAAMIAVRGTRRRAIRGLSPFTSRSSPRWALVLSSMTGWATLCARWARPWRSSARFSS